MTQPLFRLIFLCLLATAETITVSASIDAHSLANSPLPAFALLGQSGVLSRVGFLFVAILGFLNRQAIKTVGLSFWHSQPKHSLLWLVGHALALGVFGLLNFVLFIDQNALPPSNLALPLTAIGLPVAWLISGCASFACLLLVFWPWSAWQSILRQLKHNIPLAMLGTAISWSIAKLAASTWLHLSEWTYLLSKALLSLFYHGVVSNPITQALGTPSFTVEVRPECSGYEGMGLVTIFFTLFIWTARKVLRFPTAFLLYPLGIALMYLMNIVRICLLIIIGTEWSPQVALSGFHANAGWISFVAISVGIVWFSQRLPIFIPAPFPAPNSQVSNPAKPFLMPFVVLMGSTLIGGALISEFDWLYPLKVVISLTVLWFLRHAYQKTFNGWSFSAVIIGTVVFLLWIALVPVDAKQDLKFTYILSTIPIAWQYGWLFFRVIGATLTVPIVEELAFRGYLMPKLINPDFLAVKSGQFTWLSLAASSLLFGAMHGAWLAGTLAGIGYALALYRRGVVGDAIIAHSTTNALLAIYVWQTQHWSLW